MALTVNGYACYDGAQDTKYEDSHPVPIVMATAETLKGYGTIVTDFDKTEVEITPWPVSGWRKLCPGTGTQAGTQSGDFVCEWIGDKCTSINKACTNNNDVIDTCLHRKDTNIACTNDNDVIDTCLPGEVSPNSRTHVLVREANYHPDGGQVFYPTRESPFVALLALPGDDVELEDFKAFYFDGSFGFQIHANVWHQAPYPIRDEMLFLGKQGAVHAFIKMDTVTELGKYLMVPLHKPK